MEKIYNEYNMGDITNKLYKRAIIINTSHETSLWMSDCLESIKETPYPIIIVLNGGTTLKSNTEVIHLHGRDVILIRNNWNGYELGGILRGAELCEEFIFLMDTCVIDNISIIDKLFDEYPSGVAFCRGFFSYLGKYVSKYVERVGIPKITTKEDAIYHERFWNQKYIKADVNFKQFLPELPVITEVFTIKNDRVNMVLSNGYITKYKARWK